MARLIDADAFFSEFGELDQEPYNNAQTVDAEPVKHGHWIMTNKEKTDRPLPECSRCGWYVTKGGVLDFTYCPNCGAKMDEVEDGKID